MRVLWTLLAIYAVHATSSLSSLSPTRSDGESPPSSEPLSLLMGSPTLLSPFCSACPAQPLAPQPTAVGFGSRTHPCSHSLGSRLAAPSYSSLPTPRRPTHFRTTSTTRAIAARRPIGLDSLSTYAPSLSSLRRLVSCGLTHPPSLTIMAQPCWLK